MPAEYLPLTSNCYRKKTLNYIVRSFLPSLNNITEEALRAGKNIHFDGKKAIFRRKTSFAMQLTAEQPQNSQYYSLFPSNKSYSRKEYKLACGTLTAASKLPLPKTQTLVPSCIVSRLIKVISERNMGLPAEYLPPNANFPWSCCFIRFKGHAWLCLPQWSLSPKR